MTSSRVCFYAPPVLLVHCCCLQAPPGSPSDLPSQLQAVLVRMAELQAGTLSVSTHNPDSE